MSDLEQKRLHDFTVLHVTCGTVMFIGFTGVMYSLKLLFWDANGQVDEVWIATVVVTAIVVAGFLISTSRKGESWFVLDLPTFSYFGRSSLYLGGALILGALFLGLTRLADAQTSGALLTAGVVTPFAHLSICAASVLVWKWLSRGRSGARE